MRILKKKLWPHQVILKSVEGDTDQRIVWLKERIPLDNYYILGPNRYAFKREQDAVMFSLRWS